MTRVLSLAVLGLACATTPGAAQQAQLPPFEELIYLSCSDAQAMDLAERVAVARHLAEGAAAHYGTAPLATISSRTIRATPITGWARRPCGSTS